MQKVADKSNKILLHMNATKKKTWNERSLCPPPIISFKVVLTFQLKEKLLIAQKQLRDGKSVLSNHLAVLNSEQYVQDRLIYKLSSQFRSEKSMKNLKQARVCLNRLKETNFQRQLTEIAEAFDLDIVFSEEDESEAYLPSRQMLQYYLVRLMSTAALLARTCQLTYNTYIHAKQLMEIGNMLPANTLMIAIASRLWVTCKSLRSYVCDWYQALYPLLEHLQATPIPWLKTEGKTVVDQLPICLFDWLQSLFGIDVSQGEDSVISKAGQVALHNPIVEEAIDDRTKSVTAVVTEDIGVPIQRKRKEPMSHQNVVTKFAKTIDDMQKTVKPVMKNVNTCVLESANDQNNLGESKSSKNGDQKTSGDASDKKKLRKSLRKKLKSVSDVIKCLRNIQDSDVLTLGKYELVITKSLRQKCKEMLATLTKQGDGKELYSSDLHGNSDQMLKKKLIVKLLKLERQNRQQKSKHKISNISSDTKADDQQGDIEKGLQGLSHHHPADYPQSKTKFGEKVKKVNQKKKVKAKKKGKKSNVKDIRINNMNETAETNVGLLQGMPDNSTKTLKVGKVRRKQKEKKRKTVDVGRDTIIETDGDLAIKTNKMNIKDKRKAVSADGDLLDNPETDVSSSKFKRKQEDDGTEPKKKKVKLLADVRLEYKDRTLQNASKSEAVERASNNIDEHKLEIGKIKKKNKHKKAKIQKHNNKAKGFEKRNALASTKDTSLRQLKQNYKKIKKRKT